MYVNQIIILQCLLKTNVTFKTLLFKTLDNRIFSVGSKKVLISNVILYLKYNKYNDIEYNNIFEYINIFPGESYNNFIHFLIWKEI